MTARLWCVNFRSNDAVHVERFKCGCGEIGEDTDHLKVVASRASVRYDFLVTQHYDVLVSNRAAQCLAAARMNSLELSPRVTLYVGRERSRARWWALLPRGFAGVVHPSSGTRITRYNARDEQIAFNSPADPRWKSDPALYAQAGDVFRLWPFHNRTFVSDRFRACVEDNALTGAVLLPFDAKEPRSGEGFTYARFATVWLGPFPWWLADWQLAATWAQCKCIGASGLLPDPMPSFLRARPRGNAGKANRSSRAREEGWRRVQRLEFKRFGKGLEERALCYAKDEIASPGSQGWTRKDFRWDGDRKVDGRVARRWRVVSHPTAIWVTAEVRGARLVFNYFE